MKSKVLLLSVVTTAQVFFACNEDVNEVLDSQEAARDSLFTYDMFFDAEVPSYDGVTRATAANDWENGDVVYLHFGGSNDVFGKATYVSASKKWRVTCETALSNVTNASCNVWYGEGVNPKASSSQIDYDYMTEAFYTSGGKYTYSSSGIYVSASMLPLGWRLRFKGNVGDVIQVSGQNYYNCQYITMDYISNVEGTVKLTVRSNGYTDYYIGRASNTSTTISLENLTTKESFSRFFDSNTLKQGESGCFTIPSSSNLYGWTLTSPSNTINGHEFVDLGLPSGTLWATCNVDASKPEEYGGYYAWGETVTKDTYNLSTYSHCDGSIETVHYIGSDIAGSNYDVAHVKWGGTWQMPTSAQYMELLQKCKRTWTTRGGVSGILATGPNGNTIFLPAAGYRGANGLAEAGSSGHYWASTLYADLPYSAYSLDFTSRYWDWEDNASRANGFVVRAVSSPNTENGHEYVNLGLPSGTKWATCNIGATKPEEHGGYYAWGETEEKDYYDWSTYIHCDGSQETCHSIGKDIAGTEYDVAHVKWGGTWRMPSIDQIQELFDNCTRTRTTQNGVSGMLVTGPNGANVFLPAAGRRLGYTLDYEGVGGLYWMPWLFPGDESNAYVLGFDSGFYTGTDYRYTGYSVRAVCP